ncbi:MAG: type VI secretion IcmF C-terminal domain-containing protein, partial [Polyangiales bacterium]
FAVYKEQIEFVRDALQVYLDNPSQSEQLQSRLQQARARVRSLIEAQQTGFRPYFEALLWPPISGASESTTGDIARHGSDAWCNDVVAEYARSLAGHYPFNRNGQDLALTDFSSFYRPNQGRLWTFVDSRLSKIVELDGDQYSFARALGQDGSKVYSRDLLEFLSRSRDIMRSYFPSNANEPSIEFEVRVHPSPEVAMTQFTVGGKSVEHYNGPEQWKTLSWPGADPAAGATLLIKGANGMNERIRQDGPWGLMRVIEIGALMPDAGRTFTVAWQLQTHNVTLKIDFRPKRSESPFLGVPGHNSPLQLLQPVRHRAAVIPKHIHLQGSACKT